MRLIRGVIVATIACTALSSVAAQTPEQQIVNDAATALGGRDRVTAVKTMLLEGAGNFVGVTSLRYDDDIGFRSAIEQLRDVRRAYDLSNTRARFELARMVEYVFYIGDAPTRTIQGLDGTIAFNINPASQNATPAPGNQGTGRRLEYLRHPLTLVRAALGPDAKLSNSRIEGGERMVDIAIGNLPPLTLAISTTTKLPTRIFELVDNNLFGDTLQAIEFTDYKAVNGLQLPTLFTNWQDKREIGQIRINRTTIDGDVGNLAALAAVTATHADTNLLIYFPASKILTQADVYMPNDARHIIEGEPLGHAPWNRNVMENIKHRKIQVDTHAPLHGDVVPWSKFVEDTIAMTQFLAGEAPEGGGRGAGGN
jgi:hypothetical protein